MKVRQEISLTSKIPFPNEYVQALMHDMKEWAYSEDRALGHKGSWRQQIFSKPEAVQMDLEIGTGNGTHFSYLARRMGEGCLLGMEIKYKPLIQSIRQAVDGGSTNARILRYDAEYLVDLFEVEELNDVYIHFPDPWPKRRQQAHRLIRTSFLNDLFKLQKPCSMVDIKTDSKDYFEWIMQQARASHYSQSRLSFDLHTSEWQEENFETQFEKIFIRQSKPIYYLRLEKPS